ncbi:STAS domain-containing protein [Amycolatopsis sp. NPDC051903]|uniref:STAS domain-containing protein n=1 Tax=Amycolatopsis sp. NPDC051903 TaxID=3363936 RepID=UPI0037AD791F
MPHSRGGSGLTLLTSVRDDDLVLVTAAGEIDAASIGDFRTVLAQACVVGDKLVVDLSRVGFLSCAGLRVLEETSRTRPSLAVVVTVPLVLRVFDVTGAGEALDVRPGLVEACAAARA